MSLHRRRLLAKAGERGGFDLKDGDNEVEDGGEESMCGSAITGEGRKKKSFKFFYLNLCNFVCLNKKIKDVIIGMSRLLQMFE